MLGTKRLVDMLGGKAALTGTHSKGVRIDFDSKIRDGFTYKTVAALQKYLELNNAQLIESLQLSSAMWYRIKRDHSKLSQTASDRAFRLARIFAFALDVFEGDKNQTMRWMKSPQHGLGNKIPFEAIQTDAGGKRVEELLGRIEYGLGA